MVILQAPNQQLTPQGIYNSISDSYSYYKNTDTRHIRRLLNRTEAFIKRHNDYWTIQSGKEKLFEMKSIRDEELNVECTLIEGHSDYAMIFWEGNVIYMRKRDFWVNSSPKSGWHRKIYSVKITRVQYPVRYSSGYQLQESRNLLRILTRA